MQDCSDSFGDVRVVLYDVDIWPGFLEELLDRNIRGPRVFKMGDETVVET